MTDPSYVNNLVASDIMQQAQEHLRDEDHGMDEHGMDEHGLDEHGMDEHGLDEHGMDEHGMDEHVNGEHRPSLVHEGYNETSGEQSPCDHSNIDESGLDDHDDNIEDDTDTTMLNGHDITPGLVNDQSAFNESLIDPTALPPAPFIDTKPKRGSRGGRGRGRGRGRRGRGRGRWGARPGVTRKTEDGVRRTTRSQMVRLQKEKYLSLTLEEKRKLYMCQSQYVTLADIPTWGQYYRAAKLKQAAHIFGEVNDVLNEKVSIWDGDITRLEIDAIVNTANESLMGGGGIDGCIHRAAGPELKMECATLDGCWTGEAKLTLGYHLPAKYIIHTVGPVGRKPQLLSSCYLRALDMCKQNNITSIAFPCIATGIYGYPNEDAALVALDVIRQWLQIDENSQNITRIIFVLYMRHDIDIYHELMPAFFPIEPDCAPRSGVEIQDTEDVDDNVNVNQTSPSTDEMHEAI